MRITKSFVDSVPLPVPAPGQKQAQQFYRDSAITGFALRVMNSGAKSFIIEKRINGKVRRITLGKYGNLTVEQARRQAQQLLGEVASGKDPIADRKDAQVKAVTLGEAFQDYLITRRGLKPYTIKDYRRCMETGLSDWLQKPVIAISKDMVEERHRKLGKASPARANNTMRVLRAVFNHVRHKYEDAAGNPLILVNPTERLSQTRGWYKISRRQTLLKPHQLKPWYDSTLELNNETSRDYLHLLVITGLRRSEASKLQWRDVDFSEQLFSVHETKNGTTHTLPFTTFLADLLKRRYEARTGDFVFPGAGERGYLIDPKTAVTRVSDLSGVPFTLHDLRRTFITVAESLNIPAYALKRLMNHKDPNDVTAGYIVSNVDRLRFPMQQITDYFVSRFEDGGDRQNSARASAAPPKLVLVK